MSVHKLHKLPKPLKVEKRGILPTRSHESTKRVCVNVADKNHIVIPNNGDFAVVARGGARPTDMTTCELRAHGLMMSGGVDYTLCHIRAILRLDGHNGRRGKVEGL
jgi:hypothetical protein